LEDSQVLVRYTEPTWKRCAEAAIAIIPIYDSYIDYDGIIEKDSNPTEFLCIMFSAERNKQELNDGSNVYENNIELAMLKADILASETGYLIEDVFNTSILKEAF
jgi:hypothetical protein